VFNRLLRPSRASSFFLFGPRGTGKSTLLRSWFPEPDAYWVDLLDPDDEQRLSRRPAELGDRLARLAERSAIEWVVIDEVQKVPPLLELVHREIERGRFRFAMSGSSARKLKRGAANLLAGRAFTYELHPLTHRELASAFDLPSVLRFGSLPGLYRFERDEDRMEYLRAYATTYLREEIVAEQLVRKVTPFRAFLEVAAQSSGRILNLAAIGRDVGAEAVSVRSYFEILAGTLLGVLLPPFHLSVRKRQRRGPKFYFGDLGVRNALARTLTVPVLPGTYAFRNAFEHLVICEIVRLASYARKDWAFSYLQTQEGAEIDLVVDRPGERRACVEIKSSAVADPVEIARVSRLARDVPDSDAYLLSLDPKAQRIDEVTCLHWLEGIRALGL
jgi:predicted AAA+ superfamily ATPase